MGDGCGEVVDACLVFFEDLLPAVGRDIRFRDAFLDEEFRFFEEGEFKGDALELIHRVVATT